MYTNRSPLYVSRYATTIHVDCGRSFKSFEIWRKAVAIIVVSKADRKRPIQSLFLFSCQRKNRKCHEFVPGHDKDHSQKPDLGAVKVSPLSVNWGLAFG